MIKFVQYCTLLLFCLSAPLSANSEIDKLLLEVRSSLDAHHQQESERLSKLLQKSTDKATLLKGVRESLAAAKLEQQALLQTFTQADSLQQEQQSLLTAQSAQLNSLFSLSKKYAADFSAKQKQSLGRGQYPQQAQNLSFYKASTVPQLDDLKALWLAFLQEMAINSGVREYTASVINGAGEKEQSTIVQFGSFSAIDHNGQYLSFNEQSDSLQVIANQSDALTEQARAFLAGNSDSVIVDPLHGVMLLQETQKPSLEQRVHQGGLVGYIIIGLGCLGVLIALWRLLYMVWINYQVKQQLSNSFASANNPLGRVLLSVQGVDNVQRAELLIDKALLQEQPRLERCHSLVKLLAAVAPLLGLLGTVTGMIETFQSITLLGTSDPKLMAGGISQALITTVLGLCVAIPLLFCHSFISGKSKGLLQLIQQQSLLLLSDYYTPAKPLNTKSKHPNDTDKGTPVKRQASRDVEQGSPALA